jgi:hypothetical protein
MCPRVLNARAVFLGDSGQGVTTPEFERVRNKNWKDQLPDVPAAPERVRPIATLTRGPHPVAIATNHSPLPLLR